MSEGGEGDARSRFVTMSRLAGVTSRALVAVVRRSKSLKSRNIAHVLSTTSPAGSGERVLRCQRARTQAGPESAGRLARVGAYRTADFARGASVQLRASNKRPLSTPSGRSYLTFWSMLLGGVAYPQMTADDPLKAYGAHFYQGIADGVSSLDELASRAMEFMPSAERNLLRTHLRGALGRFSASELKGQLNRAIYDYRFDSKGAEAFLRATLQQLEAAP